METIDWMILAFCWSLILSDQVVQAGNPVSIIISCDIHKEGGNSDKSGDTPQICESPKKRKTCYVWIVCWSWYNGTICRTSLPHLLVFITKFLQIFNIKYVRLWIIWITKIHQIFFLYKRKQMNECSVDCWVSKLYCKWAKAYLTISNPR